jgi:uncharacterized membrane protein YgcG
MNWVKANKFLTGYIIVMVIGLGVLGYMVFSASSNYDDVLANYEKQSADYKQLRENHPFPSQQNLDKYKEQKVSAAKVINAFQVDLSKNEFPLEPLTPFQFQDLLKARVTDVRQKAAEGGVELDPKFFLGFSKYETTPPNPEAAAPLGRELHAIEWIVDQFIEHGVKKISALDRADLPEESSGGSRGESDRSGSGPRRPSGGPGGGSRGGGPGGGGAAGRQDLVHYASFDITAECKQQRLQPLLNDICGPKAPQFYIIRQLRIRNSQEKGPAKVTPAPDATGTATDKPADTRYIVGEENIEATVRIDIADFTPPTADSAVAEKSKSSSK